MSYQRTEKRGMLYIYPTNNIGLDPAPVKAVAVNNFLDTHYFRYDSEMERGNVDCLWLALTHLMIDHDVDVSSEIIEIVQHRKDMHDKETVNTLPEKE